ncbi:hypothetical protein PRNP1_004641 [Phytophthora ramorum]
MALRQLHETFKRKRHDEDLLAQCVARVLAGESATVVSKESNIPYTTLLGRVSWKKKGYEPTSRKRQMSELLVPVEGGDKATTRPAALQVPEVDEMEILKVMAKMQKVEITIRRRDVLNKANELRDPEEAECGIQWFQRFRERHPQVSGTGTNLVLEENLMQELLGEEEEKSGEQEQEVQEEKEEEVMLTPSQRAVQVLQSCYATQLGAEDMVDAFDIMADPVVARVFLVIAPGQVRDMWLKQRIKKIREAEDAADGATPSEDEAVN